MSHEPAENSMETTTQKPPENVPAASVGSGRLVRLRLFLAHGTAGALGFMPHQRTGVKDTAKNLIWLPKQAVNIVRQSPAKAWTWRETDLEICSIFARRKGLLPYALPNGRDEPRAQRENKNT